MNYGYGQTLRIVISDLQLVDVSLSGFLGEQEKRNPDRTYISGYFGQLSYRETLMSARRLSQHLALSNRIASSRSVGICTESPEYIVPAVWAAIFVDIDLVFLPYCRDPDVMFSTMKETSVAVLLTDMPSLLEKSWCLDVADMIQCDLSKDSQQQMPAMTFTTVPRQNDSGFVFQTSGTSGEPKWVKCGYRQYATVISCMLQNGTLEHARGQSVFLTPPRYHSYGLSAFLEYTAVGGMIIFPQGTSPLGPVGDIRDPWLRENVTAIEGVPYFYSQLSKLGGRFNMPALNHLGLGGGQLDRIAFGKLKEIYPAIAVSVRYGLTETPSVVSHRIIRSFSGEGWKSSGSVLPVYNVEIVDDNGQTLGTNQEGEIIVTGGCVGIYLACILTIVVFVLVRSALSRCSHHLMVYRTAACRCLVSSLSQKLYIMKVFHKVICWRLSVCVCPVMQYRMNWSEWRVYQGRTLGKSSVIIRPLVYVQQLRSCLRHCITSQCSFGRKIIGNPIEHEVWKTLTSNLR
jgi:non-ribosomal peptide synthetase component F